MIVFLLQCPKCRNTMKFQSPGLISEKSRKRCVYCGRSFKARENAIKKL